MADTTTAAYADNPAERLKYLLDLGARLIADQQPATATAESPATPVSDPAPVPEAAREIGDTSTARPAPDPAASPDPVRPARALAAPTIAPTDFLDTCSPALAEAISTSSHIVLDLETTGLTRASKPIALTGTTKIGPNLSISKILGRGRFTECNPAPRVRVVSVALPDNRRLAFDLDKMTPESRDRLFSAVSSCKVWVGQNLGFDLSWLYGLGYLPEPFVIDAMIAIRTIRPHYLHKIATAAGDPTSPAHKKALAHLKGRAKAGKSDFLSFALEPLALAYSADISKDITIDKSYQKPANWTLPDLSRAHLDYCISDITLPAEILVRALRCKSMSEVIQKLAAHPVYPALSGAVIALSKMHRNGLPVSEEGMAGIERAELARITKAAEVLAEEPLFVAHLERLTALDSTETAEIKRAIGEYCRSALGIELDIGKDGNPAVGEKALLLLGIAKDRVIDALLDLREAKKRIGFIQSWRDLSKEDGRLHGLVTQTAATGRTTASEPNIQQLPHDPIFRGSDTGIFVAKPGYKMIATDYSAIEMRIAAALALRALAEYESGKFGPLYDKDWKIQADKERIEELAKRFSKLDEIPAYEKKDKDYDGKTIHMLAWYLSRVRKTGVKSRLAEGFKHGIDPHLLTAVGVTKASGEEDPLVYLTRLSPEERDTLKKSMKSARQAAKPTNFGLLYGMQASALWESGIVGYGLDWSKEEATAARDAWFTMYPELGFWHQWSKLTYRQWPRDPWRRIGFAEDGQGLEVRPASKAPVMTPKTLTGRPLYTCTAQQLLNFQDQGTGADIAMIALANLGYLADYLVCFVHDELVIEVPESMAEQARADLEKVMIDAAAPYLDPIPAEVESAIGDWWVH